MNETIILINDTDLKTGYFRFYTTKEFHYQKIARRLGTLLGEPKTTTHKGKITSWDMKIPARLLSKTHFGIKAPQKRRVLRNNLLGSRGKVRGS